MDLDYNINLLEFSLVEICAVNVVQQLLMASGRARTSTWNWMEKVELEANTIKRIKKLYMSGKTKEVLEMLVKPINDELDRWFVKHSYFCSWANPVFTPHGTLNMMETTRAIVENESIDVGKRFLIACGFCHEQKILELAASLDSNTLFTLMHAKVNHFPGLPNQLANIWFNYLKDFTSTKIEKSALPEQQCCDGLAKAIQFKCEPAINYFIDSASPDHVPICFSDILNNRYNLKPSTYCLLFSKMSIDDQRGLMDMVSYIMLKVLLKRPYQQWFLKAAITLVGHLKKYYYWDILRKIVQKLVNGFKDYNYQELFFEFWKLGDIPRSMIIPGDLPCCICTLHFVCIFGDERMINLILNSISASDKHSILSNELSICAYFLCKKSYKTLEMFIRACGMNSKDLEIFRNSFDASAKPCRIDGKLLKFDEWESEKRNLAAIVNLIISEQFTP